MSLNDLWQTPPIGKKKSNNVDVSSFIANIMIPSDVDRKKFVAQCYKTSTVLVRSVDGAVEHSVLVSKAIMHSLTFPSISGVIGSLVQCVVDPIYGQSKVVAVFNTQRVEQEIFEEGQWRIIKRGEGTFVDIDAKGVGGELDITVNSGSSKDIESTFKFLNSSNKAMLGIMVQGNMNIEVDDSLKILIQRELNIEIEDIDNSPDKITNIKYVAGKGFSYTDEFSNSLTIKDGEFNLTSANGETFAFSKSGFSFKTSKADMKSIVSDLLDAINQSIILTPAGPGSMSPTTIAQIEKIRVSLNLLFS